MERKIDDILAKAKHNDGIKAPEGYFASFQAQMEKNLPEIEFEKAPAILPRTTWQKIRPFVYMAAMFAGIWLMLNMFNLFSPEQPLTPQTNAVLAQAITNDNFYNETMEAEGLSDYDLMNELYKEWVSVQDLENFEEY